MIEPEMAFWELDQTIELAEGLICRIIDTILDKAVGELTVLERELSPLEKVKPPFPRITYSEAVEILKSKGVEFSWGDDFGGDEETVLCQAFEKPVFVTHYPAEIKAFYMKLDPADPETSRSL